MTKASFDLTTLEGKMKAFNAQNGASISLKNLPDGTIIEADGILQYEETTNAFGNDQTVVVTTIFGTDGNSYGGVSDSVAKAGEKLIDFVEATGVTKFNVKVVKAKSNSNREFLNLQLV